jgi:hypothetical protein
VDRRGGCSGGVAQDGREVAAAWHVVAADRKQARSPNARMIGPASTFWTSRHCSHRSNQARISACRLSHGQGKANVARPAHPIER